MLIKKMNINWKDWIACFVITVVAVAYSDSFGILPIIASLCMLYAVSGFPPDNNELEEKKSVTIFIISVSTGIAYFIYFMIGSGQWNNGLVIHNEIIIFPTCAMLFIYIMPLIWMIRQKNHCIREIFSFDRETRKVTLLICVIYIYYSFARISFYYTESKMISEWMPMHMIIQSFWVAAVAEELFFRGYIYNLLKKVCHAKKARILSAFIFTFSHFNILFKLMDEGISLPIITNYISIFILGWSCAFIYEKKKSLIPCIVLHACVNNFFKYLLIMGIQNFML